MKPGRFPAIALYAALAAQSAALAAAFIAAGAWIPGCAAGLPALALAIRKIRRRPKAAAAFLAVSTAAIAAAAWLGSPSALAVLASATSLAAWDLAEFEALREANPPTGAREAQEGFAKAHYRRLAQALVLGLLAAAVGILASPGIPFAPMALLVMIDLACLGPLLFRKRS